MSQHCDRMVAAALSHARGLHSNLLTAGAMLSATSPGESSRLSWIDRWSLA